VDLEEILGRNNAHIRAKEAEARGVLAEWAGPVGERVDRLKRQFGVFLHIQEKSRLITPTEEANYRMGKTHSTRLLFDAYAEMAFDLVLEPVAFIALLGPIRARVRTTLTVIDEHEASLRGLDWERRAWQRPQPAANPGASVFTHELAITIRRVWSRVKALCSPNPVLTAAVNSVHPSDHPADVKRLQAEAVSEPLTSTGAVSTTRMAVVLNGSGVGDRSAMVEDFLLRCNQEPDLPEKIIKKHIWGAVGHKSPRQFQYWQASDDKATVEDQTNFSRTLALQPSEFVAQLKRMKLI
jgi:hypothetical protein